MPTPSGLLRKGDVLLHVSTNTRWKVIERIGNDVSYAVRLVPESGKRSDLPISSRERGYLLWLNADRSLKLRIMILEP